MEKACELCLELRPVVYCKADSAHLCLPCDAKVHSANPIVGCHHRTILCDSCKYRSVDIECLDHLMFMCRVCDASLHRKCSPHGQHRKRTLASSFTGCPSAKDFAAFWGFKLDESDGVGSNSQRFKKISRGNGHGGHYQKRSTGNSFILDQILDLKRLQLSQDQPNQEKSSSVHEHQNPSRSFEHSLDHHRLQHSQDDLGRIGSQQRDSCLPVQGLMVKFDPLPLPFPEQLEQYFPSSSSTAGFPLHTESFWQGRSTVQNSCGLKICKTLGFVKNKLMIITIPIHLMSIRHSETSRNHLEVISKMCHTPSWRRRAMQEQPRDKLTEAISAVLESAI